MALWEFHSLKSAGRAKFRDRSKPFMLDRNAWHELNELKMRVNGHTLGTEPPATKGTPNPDDRQHELHPAVACCRETRAVGEDQQYELFQGLRRNAA